MSSGILVFGIMFFSGRWSSMFMMDTVKFLHPGYFFSKQQMNPSNTLVIEVMMIAHINIKNRSTFKPQN